MERKPPRKADNQKESSPSKKTDRKTLFQFVDQRPEAVVQRQLQNVAWNSGVVQAGRRLRSSLNKTNSTTNPPIQRKIDYKKSSTTVPVDNDEEMLEFLVRKFGEEHRDMLAATIAEEAKRGRSISPYWFYQGLLRHFASQVSELGEGERGRPQMPTDFQGIKDFAVSERTTLLGSVGRMKFPIIKNEKGGDHAERIFIDRIDELSSKKELDLSEDPEVIITINNSPCNDRCANLLSQWVRRHHLTNVTVYFANPHGFNEKSTFSEDEFVQARTKLRSAGIMVRPFEPRDHISSAHKNQLRRSGFSRWNRRYNTMKSRRKRARALGRLRTPSPEKESESSRKRDRPRRRKRSRSRSREKDRHSSSPSVSPARRSKFRSSRSSGSDSSEVVSSSSRAKRQRRRGRVRDVIPGRLRNVSGSGMNCLIRATLLAALGHVDEASVTIIRDELIRRGVAQEGRMLDLADEAGAYMITFMVHNHILAGNRGIVVYYPGGHRQVLAGVNPINLWLSREHFQAII